MNKTAELARDAAIKSAVAAAYRYITFWGSDARDAEPLRQLAAAVESLDEDYICCPVCQEIVCDLDCPLAPIRNRTEGDKR